jgi:1-acyl-sn-glycerol-3-phosphate acyltransferase
MTEHPYRPPSLLVHVLALLIGWAFMRLLFRLSRHGLGRVPRRGGALIVANHRSYLDPVLIHTVTIRRMHYLMDYEFFYNPKMRWAYERLGCIPVGGSHKGSEALARAAEALERGHLLGVFPEGGVDEQGRMQPFRRGTAVLALKTGATIVPVFIAGSHEAMPKGKRVPRLFSRVSVHVGVPFGIPGSPQQDPAIEDVEELRREIQRRIASIGRAILGETPATLIPS